ncbi:hypothetical protein [Cellulomonas sp. URHE0023]|uniref:hypothetical protein n=1 Tax=Cellulomonas sp. URHE0023 TaxID=1380354 RepID=UPI000486C67C|nr:hypothetical protein [Cellulomonas sp. URHE0023]
MSDTGGDSTTRGGRPALTIGPLVGVAAVALLALAGLVVLWANVDDLDAKVLWMEVAKALIAIIAVAIIGGVVKLLLDRWGRQRDEQAAAVARDQDKVEHERAFVHESIAELESIRSGIEHARILIEAHRSSLSYRDRMQDVIALRVRLQSLRLRLEARWDDSDQYVRRLEASEEYLTALINEYRDGYKPIADIQRLDEAVVAETIKAYAGTHRSWVHDIDQEMIPALNWSAWKLLSSQEKFPRLYDFRREGPEYTSAIHANCTELAKDLLERLERPQMTGATPITRPTPGNAVGGAP